MASFIIKSQRGMILYHCLGFTVILKNCCKIQDTNRNNMIQILLSKRFNILRRRLKFRTTHLYNLNTKLTKDRFNSLSVLIEVWTNICIRTHNSNFLTSEHNYRRLILKLNYRRLKISMD